MRSSPTGPVLEAARIDQAWLREHLGWLVADDEPITVRPLSHAAGLMGDVHRIACGERSMIFKGPPSDPDAYDALVRRTGLVEREIRSYEWLETAGAAVTDVAPRCWWSALEADGTGALALEDLGPAERLSSVMTRGLSQQQARAAVRALARLHAAGAGADPLAPPLPWLFTATSAGLADWIRLGIDDLARAASELTDELAGSELRAVAASDIEGTMASGHLGARGVAICHGDVWAGNLLFTAGAAGAQPTARLVDWQYTMWGNPMSDVALLLCSSLDTGRRDAWQAGLVRDYHAALVAAGHRERSLRQCHDDLRRAEPFAALVALATLDAYISGMSARELVRMGPRVVRAVRCALQTPSQP